MYNKGFTLVELVVSMMLYSLILVLFTTSVLAFTRMYELAAKLDDVANDAETIYNIIDKAYKQSTNEVTVNNHIITIDGVSYYFDRNRRVFFADERALVMNDDLVSVFIYDYTHLEDNCYEFRVVYYKSGILNELYFILANY